MKTTFLPTCLLLPTSCYVGAKPIEELLPEPSRLRRVRQEVSNDGIPYSIYNCESIDGTGPSIITTTMSKKIIEYDYDVYIKTGTDLSAALKSIQNKLLGYVGSDIFEQCSRRLSDFDYVASTHTGRLLDKFTIEEITSGPGDEAYPTRGKFAK